MFLGTGLCLPCLDRPTWCMLHNLGNRLQVRQEQQRAGRAAQGDAADERAAPPQHRHVPGRVLRAALHGHRVLRAGVPARHPAARPGMLGAPKMPQLEMSVFLSFTNSSCADASFYLPCTAEFWRIQLSLCSSSQGAQKSAHQSYQGSCSMCD